MLNDQDFYYIRLSRNEIIKYYLYKFTDTLWNTKIRDLAEAIERQTEAFVKLNDELLDMPTHLRNKWSEEGE